MKYVHLILITFVSLCFFRCHKEALLGNLVPSAKDTPIAYIRINTSKTIVDDPKVDGTLNIVYADSSVFSQRIGVEIRGAISQALYEKKSYALELRDDNNVGISKNVFEMPEEEDWILHGPYGDKTLLRNAVAYKISNTIGKYAARTAFSELEINGSYKGFYVFMEKLKRDKNRIDVKKLEVTDNSASKITGGYIIKLDKTSGGTYPNEMSYTPANSFTSLYDANGTTNGKITTHFLYEYPKAEDITPAQTSYIQKYIQDFEKTLASDNFKDSQTGYAAYIDPSSFIDFFILTELMQNHDGYRLSTYLQKERGEKLKMGPIWDFDIAFGSDGGFCAGMNKEAWVYRYNNYCPNDTWLVPFWWKRLLQDEAFVKQLQARWTDLRANQLSNTALDKIIDDYSTTILNTGVVTRNFSKWTILGKQIFPNNFVGTYDAEIARMKQWLKTHATWIDQNIKQL